LKTSLALQRCANNRAANQCLGSFQFAPRYSPTRSLAAWHHFGQHRHYHRSRIRHPSGQPGGFRKLHHRDRHHQLHGEPCPTVNRLHRNPEPDLWVAPLTAAATSNSTGTITYSVVSGPATISGSTIIITGVGTVPLQASQVATTNYTAAAATTSFSVPGETPNSPFAAIPN
jgi:hypothetical protein